MADWYALPNSTQSEGMFELFKYVNTTAEGLFIPVILLVVWFISFIGVFGATGGGRESAARSFTFASFLVSILSVMTGIMGLLAPKFMYLTFVLVGIGVLWLKMES